MHFSQKVVGVTLNSIVLEIIFKDKNIILNQAGYYITVIQCLWPLNYNIRQLVGLCSLLMRKLSVY